MSASRFLDREAMLIKQHPDPPLYVTGPYGEIYCNKSVTHWFHYVAAEVCWYITKELWAQILHFSHEDAVDVNGDRDHFKDEIPCKQLSALSLASSKLCIEYAMQSTQRVSRKERERNKILKYNFVQNL